MTENSIVNNAWNTVDILNHGSQAAKQEVIVKLFEECSVEFISTFIKKIGKDKFYSWIALA